MWTSVGKVMSLLFNILSRFIIAFLPRSKSLLISWLPSPSAVVLEPEKIKSVTVCIFSPSICYEVMGPNAIFLVVECWVLSQLFHSSSRGFLVPLLFLCWNLNARIPWVPSFFLPILFALLAHFLLFFTAGNHHLCNCTFQIFVSPSLFPKPAGCLHQLFYKVFKLSIQTHISFPPRGSSSVFPFCQWGCLLSQKSFFSCCPLPCLSVTRAWHLCLYSSAPLASFNWDFLSLLG